MTEVVQTIFFDIGGTLGIPRISPPPFRLERLDVYPYVPDVLQSLLDRRIKIRLGIISNTGNETAASMERVLKRAGLYDYFDPDLLIYSSVVGMEKDSPAIFTLAAKRAGSGSAPGTCMFVGEDSSERKFALQAGLKVCPHPLLVDAVLAGSWLRYVRIGAPLNQSEGEWRSVLRQLPVVPLHIGGEQGRMIYAIVPQSVLPVLVNSLFDVELLGAVNDPLTTDLYLLRDDLAFSTGFLSDAGESSALFAEAEETDLLLSSSSEGLLVKMPGDRTVESLHFENALHGHNLKLAPDPGLLEPFGRGTAGQEASLLAAAEVERPLNDSEKGTLGQIAPAGISQFLDRYSGNQPLGDAPGTAINSRHVRNAGNGRTTSMLAQDLQSIGGADFSVSLHPFSHEGRTYHNVIAELEGELTDEVVLITAHLDSTAASSPAYNAALDPAPGADDDGSGVAAVLVAAQTVRQLAALKKPRKTVRFVFFNAEEQGLVGSKAYARDAAALSEGIVAVFQMDMIGYNVLDPRSFEIHAGYLPDSEVQTRSFTLAERVQRLAGTVAPQLATAQIYQSFGASDRDPAEGRSDHHSFQQRGYAACVATEDFFIGPTPASPTPEANPNYHRTSDTFVDLAYAADIARSVTAAAWVTANMAPPNTPPELDPISAIVVDENSQATRNVVATDIQGQSLVLTLNGPPFTSLTDTGPGTADLVAQPTFDDSGNYLALVRATDTEGAFDEETVAITVNNVNRPPVLTNIGLLFVHEGSQLVRTITAADPDLQVVTITAAGLPAFASFTDQGGGSGTLTLTPGYKDAGLYHVTMTATDPEGATDSESFSIRVLNVLMPLPTQISELPFAHDQGVIELKVNSLQPNLAAQVQIRSGGTWVNVTNDNGDRAWFQSSLAANELVRYAYGTNALGGLYRWVIIDKAEGLDPGWAVSAPFSISAMGKHIIVEVTLP